MVVAPDDSGESPVLLDMPADYESARMTMSLWREPPPRAELPKASKPGGIILEPTYESGERLEYQTRTGVGVGVASTAGWSVSHEIQLGPGLNLSVYYVKPMGGDTLGLERIGVTPASSGPDRGAGFRLQWKF